MSDRAYLNDLIQSKFPQTLFEIESSDIGMTGKTYIAKVGDARYFVKLDNTNNHFLTRLEELGMIPPVRFSGSYKNRAFFIQRYLDGEAPSRGWFKDHLGLLAETFRTFHEDGELLDFLAQGKQLSIKDHIQKEVELLERGITLLPDDNNQLRTSFSTFLDQSLQIDNFDFVPVHPDPNRNNFLVSENRLYLLDWDRLTLSDELRDIGPFLWWYLPKSMWPQFFELYGINDKESVMKRLYWWVARQSLEVAVWYVEHKKDKILAAEYFADFMAAVNNRSNPRGVK